MNKKLLYAVLLLPVVSSTEQNEFLAEDSSEPKLQEEHIPLENSDEEVPEEDELVSEDDDDSLDSEEEVYVRAEEARGNWYEKKKILKDAHEMYLKIRLEVAPVAGFEKTFIDKKNILTNKLEEFYQSLGGGISPLYQRLSDELQKIEELVQPKGALSPDDRIKIAYTQETKVIILQLKKDLDIVTELYKAVDQAMAVLLQQITASHNFEQKAFENYEKIAHVLSDQVAKQLYAEIVAARENIINITAYIQGDFLNYFDEVSQNIIKTISLIEQQIATLKERGIDPLSVKSNDDEGLKTAVVEQNKQPSAWYVTVLFKIRDFLSSIFTWMKGFFA